MGATMNGALMVVSELMRGSLASLLIAEGATTPTTLSLFQRLLLAKDAALALNWLHDRDRPIFHGNLTPNNVLVNDALHVKLSDYGFMQIKRIQRKYLSKRAADLISCDSNGYSRYAAPEQLLLGAPVTDKSDVYSFALSTCPREQTSDGSDDGLCRSYVDGGDQEDAFE